MTEELTAAEYEDAIRSLFQAWVGRFGSNPKIPCYMARDTRQVATDRITHLLKEVSDDHARYERSCAAESENFVGSEAAYRAVLDLQKTDHPISASVDGGPMSRVLISNVTVSYENATNWSGPRSIHVDFSTVR